MLFSRRLYVISLLVLLAASPAWSAGSGAFRVETPDAGAFGKGSAFVGEANTPGAVYYNPAGITQMKKAAISVGSAVIAPQVEVERFSGDTVQMRRQTFYVPHAYAVAPVNDRLALGVGATSYFGLATFWAEDSFTRHGQTKSEIQNQNYMLTAAYKVTDQWSLAISADLDSSKANKQKKLYQATGDGDFELDASDDSLGFRVATHYQLNEQHSFGFMYRSPIKHKYRGTATMDGLNTVNVLDLDGNGVPESNYQGVFGGSHYETDFTQNFELPQSIVLGYSFKPNSKWTFNADLEWMDWASVEQERVNWTSETSVARLGVLNNGNPASRDWKSVLSYALGAEYAATDDLRLRLGYYYHNTPIPEQNFEASLPDADSHGLTAGLGYDLTDNFTIDFAYSALIYEKRKIEGRDLGTGYSNNDGEYRQLINMYLITFTRLF